MAEYGKLVEVAIVPRTTALAADAAVSDTELEVLNAGDYDSTGGTLELNGDQLEYTGIVWGATEDDTDFLELTEPLATGASAGDLVAPVTSGGLAAEDWYAVVDMGGGGDGVPIPIQFDQRQSWPEGLYDPPVDVEVAEDLSRIQDAPGRPGTAGSRTEAWNEDEWTAPADNADAPGTLTYLPKPHSLTVEQNGLRIRNTEFTLAGQVVKPLAAQTPIRAGDRFAAYYLRDPAAEVVGQGSIGSPLVAAIQALGPIWFPVQDDASGVTMADYSGFARDGLYNNGVTLGAPQIVPNLAGRGCANYDGLDDFGQSPVAAWLNTTQIGVIAWIKADTIGTTIRTIVGRNNLAGVATFGLWITTGGKLHFEANTSTGTQQITGGTTLVAGNEYMVAGIYNGTTVQLLLNGVADAAPIGASGVMNSSLTYPAQIGALGTGGTLTDFFDGRIGPVALFDPSASPFTAADAANLYTIGQVAA